MCVGIMIFLECIDNLQATLMKISYSGSVENVDLRESCGWNSLCKVVKSI